MNNLKKFIFNNLIVLVISALIGGAIGSYLNYYYNNLSTENRNKEITKHLMLFIHHEIYKNYIDINNWDEDFLDLEGLELINLRAGNLTIKDKQLASLIRMYSYFKILKNMKNESGGIWRNATGKLFEDYKKQRNICLQEIKEYEEIFCKDKSLKSEIKIE